jgi:hypothetical protein
LSLKKPLRALLVSALLLGALPAGAVASVPNTILTSGPTGVISTASATFTFKADAGSSSSDPASFQCRLDNTTAAAWRACRSPITYSGLAEGSHRFEVRTKNGSGDGAGNFDPSPAVANFSVVIPPQTTIDSGPSGPTASDSASFDFSSSESGGFQCRLDSSAAADWEACTSPRSYASLGQGSHDFEVRAVDLDGNIDPTPASATFSVDTVAPETTIDGGLSETINVSNPEVDFSSSEAGSFECRLDSSSEDAWSSCTSPDSLSGLAEGSHTFEVRAVDAVGNVDPSPALAEFLVDTIPPEIEVDSAPATTVDVAEATFTFSASEPGTFECRLDSSDEADWVPCTSPVVLTGLAEGTHTFEVRAVDEVGNVDPTPAVTTFLVDTIAPQTTIDAAPGAVIDVAEASFAFSSTESGVFECRLDSNADASWSACSSPDALTGLSEGSHSFEVRATDQAGNTDASPAAATFFVDTPVNGARLAVTPLAGKVKVKTPDTKRFRPLTDGETIPVGSLVDTSEGKVRLASVNATGEEQWASFSEGAFHVAQKLGRSLVALKLRGKLDCSADAGASASAAHSGRKLWGSGKGNFRTTGSNGSATVRGTIWFTEDRCDGTFFKVNRGIVAVRDFRLHKTVSVEAGESYFAQIPNLP